MAGSKSALSLRNICTGHIYRGMRTHIQQQSCNRAATELQQSCNSVLKKRSYTLEHLRRTHIQRTQDTYVVVYIQACGHIYRGHRTHIYKHADTYTEDTGHICSSMRHLLQLCCSSVAGHILQRHRTHMLQYEAQQYRVAHNLNPKACQGTN